MTVTIREATPNDAEPLLVYLDRLSREPDLDLPVAPGEFDYTVEEERQILADYAAADNAIMLVAEGEGQIVGVLNCRGGGRQAMRHAATLGLSVDRAWRGQGIGTALMERVIQWARDTGIITRIELFVYARNQTAVRLYEKFGFAVEGRRRRAFYQRGEYVDDLIMALLL